MNAFELADKLQNAASSHYGELCGALWDGGAMLRHLHTEAMALRCTEMALRDRVAELEQQLAARVPDGLESALEALVNRCNNDAGMTNDPEVIAAEAALERLYKSRTDPQPVAKPEQTPFDMPKMSPIARRKLGGLVADGYSICGLMIERANEDGTQVKRGAVSISGLVLWWHPEQPAVQGEPVAWSVLDKRTGKHWYTNESKSTAQHYANHYSHRESDGTNSMVVTPLYAKPQPERVALTDEQAMEVMNDLEAWLSEIEDEEISDEELSGKALKFILDRVAGIKGAQQ